MAYVSPLRYQINRILPGYIREYCKRGGDVLEVGCGSGYISRFFLNYAVYNGVDINEREEWTELNEKNTNFSVQDATKLKFKNGYFDFALSITSLEHIKDDNLAVKELCRTLKKEKYCLIIVPTKYYWLFQLGRHADHHYSKLQIMKTATGNGFMVTKYAKLGGLFTFLYMWIDTWLSQLILLPFFCFYKLFGKKWKPKVARKVLDNTIHVLHKFKLFRKIHLGFMYVITAIDKITSWPPSCQLAVVRKK